MHRIKRIVRKGLGSKLPIRFLKGNRFIFVFHDISNADEAHHSPLYSTLVSRFEEQLNLLNEIFKIIPLEQLVSDKQLPENKNYASIHFDDGFYSVMKHARPLLRKKEIPYSVFLNGAAMEENQLWVSNLEIHKAEKEYVQRVLDISDVKKVQGENPILAIIARGKFGKGFEGHKINSPKEKIYMSREDVAQLSADGVTIGNHTYDHFVLSSCNIETTRAQIENNKSLLNELTKEKITHFALPYGRKEHFNAETISAIKKSGHDFIYSTNPNRFRAKDLDREDFLFPRICITKETPKQLLFYINRALYKKYDL